MRCRARRDANVGGRNSSERPESLEAARPWPVLAFGAWSSLELGEEENGEEGKGAATGLLMEMRTRWGRHGRQRPGAGWRAAWREFCALTTTRNAERTVMRQGRAGAHEAAVEGEETVVVAVGGDGGVREAMACAGHVMATEAWAARAR